MANIRNSYYCESSVEYDLTLRVSPFFMETTWGSIDKRILPQIIKQLINILTSSLQCAYILQNHSDGIDSESSLRNVIDSRREEYQSFSKLNVLISCAEKCINFIANSDSLYLLEVVKLWFRQNVPILTRLSLHGITVCYEVNAEQKISYIAEYLHTFDYTSEPELYTLLKSCYGSASNLSRAVLIERIKTIDNVLQYKNTSGNALLENKYRIYKFLSGLKSDCQYVNNEIDEMLKIHSEFSELRNFEPRPTFIQPMYGNKCSITKEDLLTRRPKEVLELLSTNIERIEVLYYTLSDAVNVDNEWGINIFKELTINSSVQIDAINVVPQIISV